MISKKVLTLSIFGYILFGMFVGAGILATILNYTWGTYFLIPAAILVFILNPVKGKLIALIEKV